MIKKAKMSPIDFDDSKDFLLNEGEENSKEERKEKIEVRR